MKITIENLSDFNECDQCGGGNAYGYRVLLDEDLLVELTPVAYCTGGESYDERHLLPAVLKALGYEVVGLEDSE